MRLLMVLSLLLLLLAGCAEGGTGLVAPAITSETWLNSPRLSEADLAGKVVLVDFWTFDCINCQRTVPALREIYRRYKDQGLVVVGVHSPEFDYERELQNVKNQLVIQDIPYPVAIDNDKQIWQAFGNHYWPASYLIDKHGIIRYAHVGEIHQDTAGWQTLTTQIEQLLKEQARS